MQGVGNSAKQAYESVRRMSRMGAHNDAEEFPRSAPSLYES